MSLINEFREALSIEIEEQKKKGTARWDVRGGRLVEVRGPLCVYCFVLDDPTLAGAFDDTPVLVRTANSDASGHIVGISGTEIFVAIESNLGEYVSSARILAQPYYLLERLSERLATLQEASCAIANKCLRREQFRVQHDDEFVPAQHIVSEWERLNDDQKAAVRQALGSEICYLWGPPGTGKTTTVGVAVASMIQGGQTVLLTANTNVAVDQALKAALEPEPKEGRKLLKNTDHYQEGRILRLGTPQIAEISEDPNLNLDKITERKSEPLRKQLVKLRDELNSIASRLTILETLQNDVRKWEETEKLQAQEEASQIKTANSLKELVYRVSIVENSLQHEEERLHRAKDMPRVIRFIRGMTLTGIENTLSTFRAQRDALVNEKAQAEARLKEIVGNLERLHDQAGQIRRRLNKESTSPDTLKVEITSTRAKIDDLRTQIADLERQIEAIRQQIINGAVLIATTLARTHTMTEIYRRQFNIVICDEASMAPIPALFWACSLATRAVTVAGDFRQLTAIALSDDVRVTKWLRKDVYAVAGVDKEWELQQIEYSPMVMLRTQYRMQPQIRAIVSRVFYRDQLRDHWPENTSIKDKQPCPGTYVGIYDTTGIDPWCSWTSSYSRFNLYHAVLAVKLCQIAIRDFKNIGIITPYKAQTRLIKVLVDLDPSLKDKVTVSNVHRFQGRESDLIIFDLVDSTGIPRVGKLLKGRIGSETVDDSDGARLINVACSRAKEKLAIIANLSFLQPRLNKAWSLREVLFDGSNHLPTFAADQLVPGYSDRAVIEAREVIWPPEETINAVASFFIENKFHSAVRHDLENAKRYVIIMSPFITRERLQQYVDLLGAKAAQGINVEVVTRPPHQQGASDKSDIEKMLSYLEQIGVKIVQRGLMHQKVVVTDGRIVWFGSLNPLSHRRTQELMFRMENEEFTKQVMEVCGLQTPGQEAESPAPAVDASKIPATLCTKCGYHMKVVSKGRFGPFYKCDKCNLTANVKRDDLEQAIVPEARTCQKCGEKMEIRRSRTGVFLGCSGYKDKENQCRYTRSL
jgi:predicted nucleic acid-binding Zn ribbon protein